jgi:hypothetical protein
MNSNDFVGFEAIMAACMTIRAFWDMAPCSFVEAYRHFTGAYRLHQRPGTIVRSSEASVKFETTRRYTLKAVIVNNGFTHILLSIQLLYRSSSIIFSLQTTLQTLFGT